MNFYLDTNIWIDKLNQERRNHGRAKELFRKLRKREDRILVTWVHDKEMRNVGYYE
ncbi:MAG: hypothetical protein ACOCTT_00650 [archaeon]